MPVNFLSEEQKKNYGCFCGEPSIQQLNQYFLLDDRDKAIIDSLRTDTNKIGFSVQLCTLRFLGTFINNPIDIPISVIDYLTKQLKIDNYAIYEYTNRTTIYNHARLIKDLFDYRDFTNPEVKKEMEEWIFNRSWLTNERPSVLFDMVTSKCVKDKIILPGVTLLERMVSQIRETTAIKLWERLSQLPSEEDKIKMLELLTTYTENNNQIVLKMEALRNPLTDVKLKEIQKGIKRFKEFNSFDVNSWNIEGIPFGKIQNLARYAASFRVQSIQRMSESRKMATLVSFLIIYKSVSLDELLLVVTKYLNEIFNKTKRAEQQARLRSLKDLDYAANNLKKAVKLFLDEEIMEENVRERVFAEIPKEELKESIIKVEQLTTSNYEPTAVKELFKYYNTFRKFLPDLLAIINLEAATYGQDILQLWSYLKKLESGTLDIDSSVDQIIPLLPKKWAHYISKDKKTIIKSITIGSLELFVTRLKNHEVFIKSSERYRNPMAQLITSEEWVILKDLVLKMLDYPPVGEPVLEALSTDLNSSYQEVINNWSTNSMAQIKNYGGKDSLVLARLKKESEGNHLKELKFKIKKLLPTVDLPELLLEVNSWVNFTQSFTHISESDSRMVDLDTSVIAVLLSEACNIGFTPVVKTNTEALKYDRLTWVNQNYVRLESITSANNKLIAAHSKLKIPKLWGDGTIASADGLRFVTPVKSIYTSANPKYFGRGKGITYYNFMSDQYTGIHGIVIPGTIRDSLYLLEGILEQTSSLDPKQIMTDTAGYSDIMFGLFGLLGYQFSPRIADSGNSRLWRLQTDENYKELENISRNKINSALILEYWDEMLKVAGSLKLGTVQATQLIIALQRSGRPTTLGKAIGEFGKIFKTKHLLRFISDKDYCRQILIQLNRIESRHNLCRAVNYGKKGKIFQKYKEGQEDQLGSLGLVVNAIIYWNTVYIEEALIELEQQGYNVRTEDLHHLSPLQFEHINIVGKYSFQYSEELKNGRLRKLKI